MAYTFIILSRLGRIWSSPNITAGLARLSWLLGAVLRRRPCIRRAGSRYKVRCYSSAVSIIRVLVVLQPVLAIIRAIVCAYSIQLSFRYQAKRPGFKGCLGQRQILNSSSVKRTFFLSLGKASQLVVSVLSARVVQFFTISLLCSCTGSPLLGTSSTIKALYVVLGTRLSSTKYPYRASLLLLAIPHRRQFLEQQSKLKRILSSLKLGWGLCFQSQGIPRIIRVAGKSLVTRKSIALVQRPIIIQAVKQSITSKVRILSARHSGLGANSFLIITLYFLIIDSALVNTIIVLPESTRLTISIKTQGHKLRNKESQV